MSISIGMLLLAIYLILVGVAVLGLVVPAIVTGLVALTAGVLLIAGR